MTRRANLAAGLRAAAHAVIGYQPPMQALANDQAAVRASFAAPLLCLPIAAWTRFVDWRAGGIPHPLWHAIGVNLALYVIGWAAFLLIARAALNALGQGRAWPRLAVVWNWANAAQFAVLLLASLTDLVRPGAFVISVVSLVCLFWQVWIEFRAIRPVLDTTWLTVAFVALDVALGLTSQAVIALLGG